MSATTFKSETKIEMVPVKNIITNPVNKGRTPDKDFIESIRQNGVLVPLVLTETEKKGQYMIIAGERRYHAAVATKKTAVPARILNGVSEAEKSAILLVDNIQREQMNMVQESEVIVDMLERQKLPLAEVVRQLKKDSTYVIRRAGLKNLIPEVVKLVTENAIGLTEHMIFGFSKLPAKAQKSVLRNMTRTGEYVKNGKAVHITYVCEDDQEFDNYAKQELEDSLFSLDPKEKMTDAETLQIFRSDVLNLGKMSTEKLVDGLFDDTKMAASINEKDEKLKQHVEDLKKAIFVASRSQYSEDSKVVSAGQWRKATKEDDPKKIEAGIDIDTGLLVKFVRITKEEKKQAEQAQKAGVKAEAGKPLSAAEQKKVEEERERASKERKKKIFDNKVHNLTVQKLMLTMIAGKTKFTPTDLNYLFEHGFSDAQVNGVLRHALSDEEYSSMGYGEKRKRMRQLFKNATPEHTVKCVFWASEVWGLDSRLNTAFGVDISKMKTGIAADLKKAEEAKAKAKQLTKK